MATLSRNISMILLLLCAATTAYPSDKDGFRMEVLVDGKPVQEYWHRGTTYIEALNGREYALRLSNPLAVRAAVALSVDGLNTIDAKHTDAWRASKWVLDPYETITIKGWQTGSGEARRFFFTTEENSYGVWLGKTRNLGVISAVFFREKIRVEECQVMERGGRKASALPSPAAQKESLESGVSKDEYAATGIGDRFGHRVQRVFLEMERQPCASFSIRYEFRPVLTRLGILPHPRPVIDPLERRRRARGFDDMAFCPDPQ